MPTTISVQRAAKLMGVSESGAYTAIRTNTFPVPVLRTGKRRYTVPVAPLLEALGLDELPDETTASEEGA